MFFLNSGNLGGAFGGATSFLNTFSNEAKNEWLWFSADSRLWFSLFSLARVVPAEGENWLAGTA